MNNKVDLRAQLVLLIPNIKKKIVTPQLGHTLFGEYCTLVSKA